MPARRTSFETLTAEQRLFVLAPETISPTPDSPRDGDDAGHTSPLKRKQRPRPASEAQSHRPPPRESARSARSRPKAVQSVTLRLSQPLAQALRRAAIERALEYAAPFTQQGIVEAALAEWLRRHGYPGG